MPTTLYSLFAAAKAVEDIIRVKKIRVERILFILTLLSKIIIFDFPKKWLQYYYTTYLA
jgi:Flp pilus assembly CpaE family ATPase